MSTTFIEKLGAKWDEDKFVCVGLDTDLDSDKFPKHLRDIGFDGGLVDGPQLTFNRKIVEATIDIAGCVKPNGGFYEGEENGLGIRRMTQTTELVREKDEMMPIIIDLKRGDIGNTNNGYVRAAFDVIGADAVTVSPYLGMEAMKPFLDQGDRGIIVLCRTSNKGAGEFQDRLVAVTDDEAESWGLKPGTMMPLYELVAWRVSREWNYNRNCAVVVGATYPEELARVRAIVGDLPILIPGVGAQGGDLEASVRNGADSCNQGFTLNSSRGIIFAGKGEEFAEAARAETLKLHEQINQFRNAS